MKTVLKCLLALLGLLILLGLFILNNSTSQRWLLNALGPDHDFDSTRAVAPLDYTEADSWLALPTTKDNAGWSPAGDPAINPETAQAYVFFIHPTAYLGGQHWNGTMDRNSATEENKQWMMANQASTFNGCCAVFAPYFREATIYAFLEAALNNGAKALDFAYQDVARAFEQFLSMIPEGSPFIIASHSQGTVHGQRLLQEVVDKTPLAKRLVAAYLVGCTIHEELLDTHYQQIKVCETTDDTGCMIAWDTWRSDSAPDNPACPNWAGDRYVRDDKQWLCVNPLSWRNDEVSVERGENTGSVPVQNLYNIFTFIDDKPKGLEWGPLAAPIPGLASAQCQQGVLRTNSQSGGVFDALAKSPYYHGLDYALYYQSIRDNSQRRVNAWLNKNNPK
jgi:hypothetical protein